MSYILGYGTEVWSAGNYYFWVTFPCSCLQLIHLTRVVDSHGHTLLGLYVWRFLIRLLHLHRPFTYQYTLAWVEENLEAE